MPGQCLSCTPRRRFHQPMDQILSSRPHKYSGIGNLKHRASEEYRSEVCDAVHLARRLQDSLPRFCATRRTGRKADAAEVGRNSVCGPRLPQLISRTRRFHVDGRDGIWLLICGCLARRRVGNRAVFPRATAKDNSVTDPSEAPEPQPLVQPPVPPRLTLPLKKGPYGCPRKLRTVCCGAFGISWWGPVACPVSRRAGWGGTGSGRRAARYPCRLP
jgi:hypothetical protein